MNDNSSKKIYFTTSWDDGSVNDVRLSDLLKKYAIKGTFYVPRQFDRNAGKFSKYGRRLNNDEIGIIASFHEIGAHSLTHRPLPGLSGEESKKEVCESKIFLEEIINREVRLFCYPNGLYNSEIMRLVREERYVGARITDKLNFHLPADPFFLNLSIQCAPFPFRKKDGSSFYWRKLLDPFKGYGFKLLAFPALLPSMFSWITFAKGCFEYTLKCGNYFHLYGHSWEIEKYQMWDELEKFLLYVNSFSNTRFVTNSEIVDLIQNKNL